MRKIIVQKKLSAQDKVNKTCIYKDGSCHYLLILEYPTHGVEYFCLGNFEKCSTS